MEVRDFLWASIFYCVLHKSFVHFISHNQRSAADYATNSSGNITASAYQTCYLVGQSFFIGTQAGGCVCFAYRIIPATI